MFLLSQNIRQTVFKKRRVNFGSQFEGSVILVRGGCGLMSKKSLETLYPQTGCRERLVEGVVSPDKL